MKDISDDDVKTASISTYMTVEEAKIISEVITKVKSRKVIEIGSYCGFSALHIAKALYEMNKLDKVSRKLISIDVKDKAFKNNEKCFTFLKENKILEFLVGDASILLKDVIKRTDTVFIDGNYHKDGIYSMWKIIKSSSVKTIIMHDVMCKNVENAMWCNAFFQEKSKEYEHELFQTKDNSGNYNGVGVLHLSK